jgi:hypothetical protein
MFRMTLGMGLAVVLLGAMAVPAGAAGKQVERPFGGIEAGVSVSVCDDSGFPVVVCDVTTVGSGNIKHLGRMFSSSTGTVSIDLFAEPCELPDGSLTGVPIESSGTFVFVAANGDGVHGIYDQTLCSAFGFSAGSLQGAQTITGGTGRFEGATGETVTNGTVDEVGPDTFAIESVGTITY